VSTATIEELQRIVTDETRSTEDRRAAAEHILALQANTTVEPAPAVDPALAKRRAQFTGAQRRLADILAISGQSIQGGKGFHLIDADRAEVSVNSDKLVAMQIVRLMLDDDGSDGILYAAINWKSQSQKTLADRMGDHPCNHECDPAYRLGMQSPDKRRAYVKKQCDLLGVPYLEPQPELKLDAKALVRMSSQQFAEFAIEFHRRVLSWDLKQYVYDNLHTPAAQFFAEFVALQKQADAEEESLFKNAMAAHMLATAADSDDEDAEEFLGLLAWMGQRSRLEDMRRLERIAKQKSRGTSPSQAPKEWTIKETVPARSPLDDIDLKKVESFYDRQLAEIDAELEALNVGQQEQASAGISE
jgi:hypothetical protein